MDDFDNFVRHEEFGTILELAATLHRQQARLAALARGAPEPRGAPTPPEEGDAADAPPLGAGPGPDAERPRRRPGTAAEDAEGADAPPGRPVPSPVPSAAVPPPAAALDPAFDRAAGLVRAALLPSSAQDAESAAGVVLGRGECPVTDSLVDETIRALADELQLCLDLKKKLRTSRRGRPLSEGGAGKDRGIDAAGTGVKMEGGGEKAEGVDEKVNHFASKFAKWQSDILIHWMIEHRVSAKYHLRAALPAFPGHTHRWRHSTPTGEPFPDARGGLLAGFGHQFDVHSSGKATLARQAPSCLNPDDALTTNSANQLVNTGELDHERPQAQHESHPRREEAPPFSGLSLSRHRPGEEPQVRASRPGLFKLRGEPGQGASRRPRRLRA